MWFVYLIRCRDGSLYCGITNNPRWRLAQHQKGQGAAFTQMRGAEEMRVIMRCESRSEALKAESMVKKLKRAEKLKWWEQGETVGGSSGSLKPLQNPKNPLNSPQPRIERIFP